MPNISAIRNWTSSVNAEPGFLTEVFDALKTLSPADKHCNLILDAMAIKKQIVWDKKNSKYVGFSDYGNELDLEGTNTPATEVLVFMLVSLNGKWKVPVGYVFQNKISASTQAELINSALTISHNAGLKVWGVTCDGAFTNFSSMKILGCLFDNIDNYDDLKCWFDHPVTTEKVFFIPDPCHMVKLARNTLGNNKTLISNEGAVKWSYIDQLFEVQNQLSLKFANKLSQAHVKWQNNKMKVKLAAQTLSASTADALTFLKNMQMDNFHNVDATVTFCRNIDRLFDFLNTRNPFGKGFKSPIFPSNVDFLESVVVPIVQYLFSLKIQNQSKNLQFVHTTNKKSFVIGFAIATKSILSIAKALFHETPHFKYVLSYKFSQDHIEILFSRFRQKFGSNNNPNILQFKTALKQILMKNAITCKTNGNCNTFDNDVFGDLLEFKWNRKKENLNEFDEIENKIDEDIINRMTLLNSSNKIMIEAKENILYYISGYIVKKVCKIIDCNSCITSLTENINEHDYSLPLRHKQFVLLKNQGGLVITSNCVYRIIKESEISFLYHTNHLSNINIKNLDKKIISHVINKFVLDHSIFKNLSCENVEILERPHKLVLITLIVKKFLSVRLHSYGKQFSSDLLNPVSKRQKLTKTILFYNQ